MAVNLSVQRHLQYSAVQVGDEIEEIVKLSNPSLLPVLWAEFNDFSNIPGYTLSSARAVDGQSILEWRVHSICQQRGNYHFGPWEISTGDPFGIFRVVITYNQQEDILVYPPLATLPEQIFAHGRTQGDDRSLHLPLLAESLSSLSTRPYVPGDPLRHIHWPTSARQAAPYVKVFDPEASSTLWLIADFDSAHQFGNGNKSTLETSIIVLATLADRFLSEKLAVGLIAYTKTPYVLVPARGRAQFWQILRILAGVQPSTKPFSETLAQARSLITGRDRVIAITSALQPEWVGELVRLGSAHRGTNAEAILLFSPNTALEKLQRTPGSEAPSLKEILSFSTFLASTGIPAHVLNCDEVQPRMASYGELSRWDFQTLGTGRAFARHAPRQHSVRSAKN
jgi:uncharacterized protein (DUF58 family)